MTEGAIRSTMARYRYEALSVGGELLRGAMEAPDQRAVVSRLQAAGHLPLRVEPFGRSLAQFLAGRLIGRAPIRQRELAAFTRELAALLHAGLPLDRALQIVIDVAQDAGPRALIAALQLAVRGGRPLSDALEAQQGVFTPFYVSMVRAAETAGTLDRGLARLAEHEERNRVLRDTVLSALIYPLVVLAVAGVSLLVILTYVVPQFTQLFADAGKALPLSTQAVVAASELLRDYWWALCALAIGGTFAVRAALSTPAGRYRWDALVLRIPLWGELTRRIEMARLSRSLATLLASGVPLVKGLAIAKDILSNRVLADALDLAMDGLKAGRGLAGPLLSTGLFPVLGLQMAKVGEETGHLGEMLERIAELYDREVASATQKMLALLEPLLIVGLGVVVAGVIMSLLLAIVSVHDLPL